MDLTVRVTVSYRCEPERARDVLLACAAGCPDIAAEPAPLALLDDFADNGFAFVVRARAAGSQAPDETASALRFAIVRSFRAHDIEIAVPQADVRWRDLDFVRQAFALAMAQRGVAASDSTEDS